MLLSKPMSHLSVRISGETIGLLVDVMEFMFTLLIKDELKLFIIVGGSR